MQEVVQQGGKHKKNCTIASSLFSLFKLKNTTKKAIKLEDAAGILYI